MTWPLLETAPARRVRRWFSDERFGEILTGSAFSVVARVLATAFGLATNVIVARYYGADMLGIVAVLNSFLLLGTTFTLLGTGTSILRLIPEHLAKYSPGSAFRLYRRTQFLVAAVSVVTGSALFLGAEQVASKVFDKPHLSGFLALAAAFVVFQALASLNTQAVRGLRLIRTYSVMQVLPALLALVLLVAATVAAWSPDSPVYAHLGGIGLTAVIGMVVMDRTFRRRTSPKDRVEPVSTRALLTISLPMLMTSSLSLLIGQIGVVMLGMFRPEEEVGYYAVAVRMATLVTFMLTAINSMAAPKFSELFQKEQLADLFYVAKKSAKLIFWTTAPLLLGLLVLGKPLLVLFFGSPFGAAYPALALLVIGQFVNSVSGSTGMFMNMTGRQSQFRNIILAAAVINVSSNLFLIPRYGLVGAALTAMITISFWNLTTLWYIKSRHGRTVGYLPWLSK
jgi:O-antigen/teichoic acid export membrane protein